MHINTNSMLNEDISERMRKVEEHSKLNFPPNYIDFIKKYNVGIPVTNEFYVTTTSMLSKDSLVL